jgi:UDP-N-acetylbacillosamine N-acetyltransferase
VTPLVVIWGASGHARVVADIVRLANTFRIVGFLDDVMPTRAGEPFAGSKVLGGSEQLEKLREQGVYHLLIAFGDCEARLHTGERARTLGFELATAIHPRAIVAEDAVVGRGTVICAGAVVNPGAKLGALVIVNTGASVDHDCELGDGVHVAPGARLAGNVVVGRGATLGVGATVVNGVLIGERSLIGAGAVVVRSIGPGVVAYGVPARVIRTIATKRGGGDVGG